MTAGSVIDDSLVQAPIALCFAALPQWDAERFYLVFPGLPLTAHRAGGPEKGDRHGAGRSGVERRDRGPDGNLVARLVTAVHFA